MRYNTNNERIPPLYACDRNMTGINWGVVAVAACLQCFELVALQDLF